VRAQSAALSGARFSVERKRVIAQYFQKCTKPRFHKDFCNIINFTAASLAAAATCAGGVAAALSRRLKGARAPVKKILGNVRARAPPLTGFDANRANRSQVIRGKPRLR
jgi:hypothetical protein